MTGNLINLNEVTKKLSIHKSTIYRLLKNDDFPKQIKLGGKIVRWRESDIDEWIERKTTNQEGN